MVEPPPKRASDDRYGRNEPEWENRRDQIVPPKDDFGESNLVPRIPRPTQRERYNAAHGDGACDDDCQNHEHPAENASHPVSSAS
jgi:hypothetical protein